MISCWFPLWYMYWFPLVKYHGADQFVYTFWCCFLKGGIRNNVLLFNCQCVCVFMCVCVRVWGAQEKAYEIKMGYVSYKQSPLWNPLRTKLFFRGMLSDLVGCHFQVPEFRSYMGEFPFPFYVILRDINSLPQVLSDALRQWFELVTASATWTFNTHPAFQLFTVPPSQLPQPERSTHILPSYCSLCPRHSFRNLNVQHTSCLPTVHCAPVTASATWTFNTHPAFLLFTVPPSQLPQPERSTHILPSYCSLCPRHSFRNLNVQHTSCLPTVHCAPVTASATWTFNTHPAFLLFTVPPSQLPQPERSTHILPSYCSLCPPTHLHHHHHCSLCPRPCGILGQWRPSPTTTSTFLW